MDGAVGRILDTIFNNNHDSSSSSLLSNVLDDFEVLETPSHSSQSTSQSSSTRSSTEATTATTTSEASTSPRKVTPTHSMAAETAVPESSSNADNDSSSSSVDDTEVSV